MDHGGIGLFDHSVGNKVDSDRSNGGKQYSTGTKSGEFPVI